MEKLQIFIQYDKKKPPCVISFLKVRTYEKIIYDLEMLLGRHGSLHVLLRKQYIGMAE